MPAKYTVDPVTGCWNWHLLTEAGYPVGRAHRRLWRQTHGPIPDGFHIHHVCRNRACVNPDPAHLEARAPRDHWAEHYLDENGMSLQDVQEIRRLGAQPGSRTRRDTGEEVEGLKFTLVPATDPHANRPRRRTRAAGIRREIA
jgi:hypothetical protein